MRHLHATPVFALALATLTTGCDDVRSRPELPTEAVLARSQAQLEGAYTFSAPVFDIAAMPDGGILIAEGNVINTVPVRGRRSNPVGTPRHSYELRGVRENET